MTSLILFGIPVAALAIVLLVGFVGCQLGTSGLPGPTFDEVVSGIPSLVAWWHLNEASGPTAADSKDAHNGTYTSAPVAAGTESADAPGLLQFGWPSLVASEPAKKAINVDGGGVVVPFSADLNKPQFTIQAWAQADWPAGAPAYRCVVFAEQSEAGSVKRGFSLYANPQNTWEVFVGDGTKFASVAADKPITQKSTDYLAATYDGMTLTLYVNGEQRGSAALGFQPNTSHDLSIGQGIASEFNPTYPFSGRLQEVAYYNEALDQQTILNIFMRSTSG